MKKDMFIDEKAKEGIFVGMEMLIFLNTSKMCEYVVFLVKQ
jgi:hypothetical protein